MASGSLYALAHSPVRVTWVTTPSISIPHSSWNLIVSPVWMLYIFTDVFHFFSTECSLPAGGSALPHVFSCDSTSDLSWLSNPHSLSHSYSFPLYTGRDLFAPPVWGPSLSSDPDSILSASPVDVSSSLSVSPSSI